MSAGSTVNTPPPRGTRPRNRRELILAAASDLFYQRGYDQVAISDIAERVGIGPSALYRHFPGKQQLLSEVVLSGLTKFRDALESPDLASADQALPALAALALDERRLGVLWQRETRYLPREERAKLRPELQTVGGRLSALVLDAGAGQTPATADLIAWAVFSVLVSPSFHNVDLARTAYERLLVGLSDTVLRTPLPMLDGAMPTKAPSHPMRPHSRREALLAEAVRMFAVDGYASVGIEDVGAAVGIAGPSVYNHFPSKLDLLVTAIERGGAYLMLEVSTQLMLASGPEDALDRLIASYVKFALQHHHIVDLTIGETRQLPDEERQAALHIQREYAAEWLSLMQELDADLDPIIGRIRLQAAFTIVNDASRTAHLRATAGLAEALEEICRRILVTAPAR